MTHITVRDHKYTPRARWTASAVTYTEPMERERMQQTEPRSHADCGMSLAEIDAWLVRGEIARHGTSAATRCTTPRWHRRPDGTYRAVVLYWGRWDVARSCHIDATHPRTLWVELCARGVIDRRNMMDGDAYAAWLMLGRCEQVTA